MYGGPPFDQPPEDGEPPRFMFMPMPMPVELMPEHHTVINNIYQQTPLTTELEDIDWVPTTLEDAHRLAYRAVVAGSERWNSSPLWVIRAEHAGDLIPGKFAVNNEKAYVGFEGKEHFVDEFEVLCAAPGQVQWLLAMNGDVPPGAIPAGNTHDGEPLYVGRASHRWTTTPGKVHPSYECMFMPYGGNEVSFKTYEVLCRVL